jgi:hypothetical protein
MDKIFEDQVSLAFIGDICLAGGMQKHLREKGYNHPFEKVKSALSNSDLTVGNLECCITSKDRAPPIDSKNKMAVSEELCLGLTDIHLDVVTLANNHILDDGIEGLLDTTIFLEKNGIQYHGAGINSSQAETPLIVKKNGFRIAFIGGCDVPYVNCDEIHHGTARCSFEHLSNQIKIARNLAEIIVVQLHADLEFTQYPSLQRVRLSRNLVDSGAHLIIQHHPHVCQGIEYYKNGIIAYSLGNFIFRVNGHEYLQQHEDTNWGMILHITAKRENKHIKFTYNSEFTSITSENTTVITDEIAALALRKKIDERSIGLKKTTVLMRNRFKRCHQEFKTNLYKIYYEFRRHGISESFSLFLSIIRDPYQRRWMFGLITLGYHDGPSFLCNN